jgi:hypothetical protein
MKRERNLTRYQVVRWTPEAHQKIEEAAERLGLSASEITRRCVCIGLPALQKIDLPGVPERKPTEAA